MNPMRSRLILLEQGDKHAWVYPEQGFQLHGFGQDMGERGRASVIFRPPATHEPPDRRYGNPVLFPNPSASTSRHGRNSWEWKHSALAIPFHGLARNTYWHVVDLQSDRVTGEMASNSSTQLAFPFDFRFRLTYRLDPIGLVLDAHLENTGTESFPYALGFHPYLQLPLTPQGGKAECWAQLPGGVQMQSSNEWISMQGRRFESQRIRCDQDLADSIVLVETGAKFLEVEDRANRLAVRVSVESSENSFPVWVIWSASPTAPYICLEPWTDLPNALNRPETRRCEPGQIQRYQMVLSVRAL